MTDHPFKIKTVADLEAKMLDLTNWLANSVHGAGGTVQEKIDALRAITAVYTTLAKNKPEEPTKDEGDGFDFSKGIMNDKVANVVRLGRTGPAENGEKVGSDRGPRRTDS